MIAPILEVPAAAFTCRALLVDADFLVVALDDLPLTTVAETVRGAANFAELLFRFGYLDTAALTGMLKAWRETLMAVGPDRLLLNFEGEAEDKTTDEILREVAAETAQHAQHSGPAPASA